MSKGIVMELTAKTAIVLTPQGSFEEIPKPSRDCRVGEEIEFYTGRARKGNRWLAATSSLVAAVVFGVILLGGLTGVFADKKVVAYVSIDINPSVELGVDSKEKVRELRALNPDAASLIQGVSYAGKPLSEVTEDLLAQAEARYLNKGEADIVISSTLVSPSARLNDTSLSQEVKELVSRHVQETHPENAQAYVVTAFAAPKEVRDVALDNGLSTGKYIVYLNAKSSGAEVGIEDFKEQSVHQIAREQGGIRQWIQPGKVTKESLQELLKQEKSGELDRKLQEQKDSKKDESGKPSAKPSDTPSAKPSSDPSSKPAVTPGKPSPKPAVSTTPGRTPEPSKPGKAKEEDKDKPGSGNKDENQNRQDEKKKEDNEKKQQENKKQGEDRKQEQKDQEGKGKKDEEDGGKKAESAATANKGSDEGTTDRPLVPVSPKPDDPDKGNGGKDNPENPGQAKQKDKPDDKKNGDSKDAGGPKEDKAS
ncbi:anti-sigma factor domain-containing protein [Paenibacillus sp. CC-CFT747]|nr:anti-sigma factor domain-containing protein [Paenibacillus sp. CC-CFT747]